MILLTHNLAEAKTKIDDLVKKSSGVFLWVVLACRSLLAGFANFDSLTELQQRIGELPPELEQLFEHMLDQIESRYQARAMRLLQTCHSNHLEPRIGNLSTLGLALVDEHHMDLNKIPRHHHLTSSDKRRKCQSLEGRLRSRCWGLLEIRRSELGLDDFCYCFRESSEDENARSFSSHHDSLVNSSVEFMHRSVFDFLTTRDFSVYEERNGDQDPTFNPYAVLACISMHAMNQCSTSAGVHVGHLLSYSSYAERSAPNLLAKVFFALEERIRSIVADRVDNCIFTDFHASDKQFAILFAVEARLIGAVHALQSEVGLRLSTLPLRFPLLYYALCKPALGLLIRSYPMNGQHTDVVEVVQYLLQAGCGPNESFGPRYDSTWTLMRVTTAWKMLLELVAVEGYVCDAHWPFTDKLVQAFLDAGTSVRTGQAILKELDSGDSKRSERIGAMQKFLQAHDEAQKRKRCTRRENPGNSSRIYSIPSLRAGKKRSKASDDTLRSKRKRSRVQEPDTNRVKGLT